MFVSSYVFFLFFLQPRNKEYEIRMEEATSIARHANELATKVFVRAI